MLQKKSQQSESTVSKVLAMVRYLNQFRDEMNELIPQLHIHVPHEQYAKLLSRYKELEQEMPLIRLPISYDSSKKILSNIDALFEYTLELERILEELKMKLPIPLEKDEIF